MPQIDITINSAQATPPNNRFFHFHQWTQIIILFELYTSISCHGKRTGDGSLPVIMRQMLYSHVHVDLHVCTVIKMIEQFSI